MRVLTVMDAHERLNAKTDSTLAILAELTARGHTADFCEPGALSIDAGEVRAIDPVASYDAVFIRKDPPFDLEYYFMTLLLERARGETFFVNDPRSLRECNEKLFIFEFPDLIPRTSVTRDISRIQALVGGASNEGEWVVKPLDGCGGSGVFHLRAGDRNIPSILETITCGGTRHVMVQAYLPASRVGDKRILLLDGEPIGQVLRVPSEHDNRANLHVGGHAAASALDDRDREICARVGPVVRARGLCFVGIDVIGGMLTEINVTSPTGIREINHLTGDKLEARIVDWLEAKLR